MNCPHCQTEIDEHEANRCLDAWVTEVAFDLSVKRVRDGRMVEEFLTLKGFVPLYSADIAAAWEIHGSQIERPFSKRREYLLALEEELREREKFTVAWPDALIFLSPLAICRAAIKAAHVGG